MCLLVVPVSLVGCKWLLWHGLVSSRLATGIAIPYQGSGSMTTNRTKSPHLSDLLFLNGDQSRQGAVGMLELVTCGGEGEEGAQLWVPWAQPGAPGWPAAPSSWERRTSCMAAGPSSCVGDGKATCPRHWAPGIQVGCHQKAKNLPQSVAWTDGEPTAVACPFHAYSHASSDQPGLV